MTVSKKQKMSAAAGILTIAITLLMAQLRSLVNKHDAESTTATAGRNNSPPRDTATPTQRYTGIVTDNSGHPIANAKMLLITEGVPRTAYTDENGVYTFTNVPQSPDVSISVILNDVVVYRQQLPPNAGTTQDVRLRNGDYKKVALVSTSGAPWQSRPTGEQARTRHHQGSDDQPHSQFGQIPNLGDESPDIEVVPPAPIAAKTEHRQASLHAGNLAGGATAPITEPVPESKPMTTAEPTPPRRETDHTGVALMIDLAPIAPAGGHSLRVFAEKPFGAPKDSQELFDRVLATCVTKAPYVEASRAAADAVLMCLEGCGDGKNYVRFELRSQANVGDTLLWGYRVDKEPNNGVWQLDLAKATQNVCAGREGLQRKFSAIASQVAGR